MEEMNFESFDYLNDFKEDDLNNEIEKVSDESLIDILSKTNKNISRHYVNNNELKNDIINYYSSLDYHEQEQLPEPKIPDSIGIKLIRICEHLSKRYNFTEYTFRDEMVLNAIEDCVAAVKNRKFDPNLKIFHKVIEIKYEKNEIIIIRCKESGEPVFKPSAVHSNALPKNCKLDEFISNNSKINSIDKTPNINDIYVSKFTTSALSFFTRTAWNTMVQMIKKEKREEEKKHNMIKDPFIETSILQETDSMDEFEIESKSVFIDMYNRGY